MATLSATSRSSGPPHNIKDLVSPRLVDSINFRMPRSEVLQMWEQVAHKHSLHVDLKEFNAHAAVEEFLRSLLITKQRTKGQGHNDALGIMHCLATAQTELGRYDQAVQTYRELLELHEAAFGSGSSYAVMSNLAFVLNKQGKHAEAEPYVRRLFPLTQAMMGQYSPKTLGAMRQLIEAVGKQGRWEEAEELLEEGLRTVAEMASGYREEEVRAMKDVEADLKKSEGEASSTGLRNTKLEK